MKTQLVTIQLSGSPSADFTAAHGITRVTPRAIRNECKSWLEALGFNAIVEVEAAPSEAEMTARGEAIATALMLPRDPEHDDRYVTGWGTKTALGLYRTLAAALKEPK